MTAPTPYNIPLGACTNDPDRWTTTPDAEAKGLCRACPRRWQCAREAVEATGAEGLWAGVVIPESGRPRTFALNQLRSLAERHGYPVRETAKSA
ncbi:WhiB family transcriptional regulator [Mycobacterium sp. Dal123C01]|uniref:WhiB family transcriptional regulator n=1 Tax=Mycobacterium sp. Dal123C01 TaxID=3457577 RepID=UPI00403E4E9F